VIKLTSLEQLPPLFAYVPPLPLLTFAPRRLVVKYFCDTCKDGVGREFVMAKCKQNRHTMRQERQIVELQEDKERKNRKFNGADGEGMVLGTGIEWNGASVKYWNPGER